MQSRNRNRNPSFGLGGQGKKFKSLVQQKGKCPSKKKNVTSVPLELAYLRRQANEDKRLENANEQ